MPANVFLNSAAPQGGSNPYPSWDDDPDVRLTKVLQMIAGAFNGEIQLSVGGSSSSGGAIISNSDPARNAAAVSPNDAADLANTTRGLLIGTAGNVKVDMAGGQAGVILTGLVAGQIYPVCVTRVYNTSTTAGSIVALW